MPIKAGEQIVKTLDFPVTKRGEDGQEVADTLHIKYRPVTQGWLDKWEEEAKREVGVFEEVLRLRSEIQRLAAERAEEAAVGAARAALDEYVKQNPAPEHEIIFRQMAELLADVDHVDAGGKPVPVTVEFLATFDKEMILDIKERIEKKLFRRQTI